MIEKNVRREIFKLMELLWLWPIVPANASTKMSKDVWGLLSALQNAAPSQKHLIVSLRGALNRLTLPPIGRPDILVLNPVGRGLVIEVKVFSKPREGRWAAASFDTKRITPEQRNWLRMYEADGGLSYLGLGTIHGLPNNATKPRMLWLIPWSEYLKHEEHVLLQGTSTIPLTNVKGMRVGLRQLGLWAMEMFKGYAMIWDDGQWHMPTGHPLAKLVDTRSAPTYSASLLPDLVPLLEHTQERDLKAWRKEWKKE